MMRILTQASAERLEFDRVYLKLGTYVQMGKKTQQMENKMSGCFGKTLVSCFMGEAYFKKGQKCPHQEFQACVRDYV